MEQTKKKFNLIDLIVILAILAAAAFVIFKLSAASVYQEKQVKYRMTFYTDESTYFSLEKVKNGQKVCDESNNYELGTIVKTDIRNQSEGTLETADGKYVIAAKPGYGSGYITFEGTGTDYEYGAKFEKGQYSVGQTVTIRAGQSKLYGRIYSIEKITK